MSFRNVLAAAMLSDGGRLVHEFSSILRLGAVLDGQAAGWRGRLTDGGGVLFDPTPLAGPFDTFTLSVWFRFDAPAYKNIDLVAGLGVSIYVGVGGLLTVRCWGDGGLPLLCGFNTVAQVQIGDWSHLLVSADQALATDTLLVNLNGVDGSNDRANAGSIYHTDDQWGVGEGDTNDFDGCIAELWADFSRAEDVNDPAIIAKFRSAGKPVELGIDGELPFGASPDVYLSGGDFGHNWGDWGSAALADSSKACESSPAL